MLQLLPTTPGFPSELPESWNKFNAGLQSEKLRQKECGQEEGETQAPAWERGKTQAVARTALSLPSLLAPTSPGLRTHCGA